MSDDKKKLEKPKHFTLKYIICFAIITEIVSMMMFAMGLNISDGKVSVFILLLGIIGWFILNSKFEKTNQKQKMEQGERKISKTR